MCWLVVQPRKARTFSLGDLRLLKPQPAFPPTPTSTRYGTMSIISFFLHSEFVSSQHQISLNLQRYIDADGCLRGQKQP